MKYYRKMNQILMVILWVLLPLQANANATEPESEPQLVVQFKDLHSQYQIESESLELVSPQKKIKGVAVYQFKLPPSRELLLKTLSMLKRHSAVNWAMEDEQAIQLQSVPNDALYDQQSWLDSIELESAWGFQTSCDNTIIAILDSGLDRNHPDIINNLWVNPYEIEDNGLDDDGNGYIDDVSGWNTINENAYPIDNFGHGTHVAGIAAAQSDNFQGVAGVCWQANILPIKFLDQYGSGSVSNAIEGIYYLITLQAQFPEQKIVLNNSWAATYNVGLEAAINDATQAGIVVVNAAGNSSRDLDQSAYYPAAYAANDLANITVTNMNTTSEVFELNNASNYGRLAATIAAPGTDIYSTWPEKLSTEEAYRFESGTSMAAPIISGVAALLWANNPDLSAQEVRAVIENGSMELVDLLGKQKRPGLVNALRSMNNVYLSNSSLGYLQVLDGKTFIKGVNLDALTGLSLDSKSIEYTSVDAETVQIDSTEKITCGYLQADTANIVSSLYVDMLPPAVTELSLSDAGINNQVLIRWHYQGPEAQVVLEASDEHGVYTEFATATAAVQEKIVALPVAATHIRAKSKVECEGVDFNAVVKESAYSESIALDSSGIQWQTQLLSNGLLNQFYSASFYAEAATHYSVSTPLMGDCLPDGLSFSGNTLSGIPVGIESCSFTVIANNALGSFSKRFILDIKEASGKVTLKGVDTNIPSFVLSFENAGFNGVSLERDLQQGQHWSLKWRYTGTGNVDKFVLTLNSHYRYKTIQLVDAAGQIHDILVPKNNNLELILPYALNASSAAVLDDEYQLNIELESQVVASSNKRNPMCILENVFGGNQADTSLVAFRSFRDDVLMASVMGRQLVGSYYQLSAKLLAYKADYPKVYDAIHDSVKWYLQKIAGLITFFMGHANA